MNQVPLLPAIIKKAAPRALGLWLLLAVSYRVLGRWPHAATWICLGGTLTAVAVYTAWRDVKAKKPRLP